MDIWDFIQHRQISKVRKDATEARVTAGHSESRIVELERRVDRLVLASAAMLELLEEKTGLGQDEIRERMRAIDLRDGKEDGRMRQALVQCRKCRRDNGPGRGYCIYCGTRLIDAPPVA